MDTIQLIGFLRLGHYVTEVQWCAHVKAKMWIWCRIWPPLPFFSFAAFSSFCHLHLLCHPSYSEFGLVQWVAPYVALLGETYINLVEATNRESHLNIYARYRNSMSHFRRRWFWMKGTSTFYDCLIQDRKKGPSDPPQCYIFFDMFLRVMASAGLLVYYSTLYLGAFHQFRNDVWLVLLDSVFLPPLICPAKLRFDSSAPCDCDYSWCPLYQLNLWRLLLFNR